MKGRSLSILSVALVAASLVLQTQQLVDRLQAGKTLRTVELITQQLIARGQLTPAALWHHVHLLEEASRLDPVAAEIHLARGSQYLLLGRAEEAIAAYQRALELEPRPEIYLNLGRAQAMAEDAAAAGDSFESALRLDPRLQREVPEPFRRGG